MQVNVHLHGILREALPPEKKGRSAIQIVENATISTLLSHLGISRRVEVAINDEMIDEMETALKDGDHVVIFTIIGGG